MVRCKQKNVLLSQTAVGISEINYNNKTKVTNVELK